MSIYIDFAVIHNIVKEKNSLAIAEIDQKEVTLDVTTTPVKALVGSLVSVVGKKNNSVIYGQFRTDHKEGPFPHGLDSYLENTPQSNISFLDLTSIALQEIARCAAAEPLATGGYLLFSQYQSQGTLFFIAAMIKHKDGIRLNKDLVPEGVEQLDLSKIYHAVRINISLYEQYRLEVASNEISDKCYIGFIGKSNDGKASGYFVEAFGCEKGVAAGKLIDVIVNSIETFFTQTPELIPLKQQAKEKLLDYLGEKESTGNLATIDGIKFAMATLLTEQQQPLLDNLESFLNDEERKIPAEFSVSKRGLQKHLKIKAVDKENGWTMQFERSTLGRTEDSIFFYDEENERLIISSLPTALKSELKKELDSRDSVGTESESID